MKNILLKKRFLLLLLLGLISILFLKSDWLASFMYPIHYKDDIRASASNYGIEPHLVAAIIRAESNYETGRESKKGALGLMQLMPTTADWVVQKAGFEAVDDDILRHRADVSIEVGTWYLGALHKQFDQNVVAAVAAYNAGPGNVRKWLDSGSWNGKMNAVKDIPFGETRHYVQRVIYYYNKYKELYPTF
ncbi:lytic transglycosylase domain-containing protein [Paenibacillus sp. GSMTC-2017]|uniref:lytic transglycosylase domain-containing protein n=1 Tax=Paenibacillus sp. GSMTC-2017 TaxID=2794350 RepID=UPI0018D8CB96|nr:lytic transglycosylase domain-containing protein [Paenibacillus sp. GSMTC-2017]MBH5318481.1 lytic transglycosylase domain-containing protein [Paenibacillus sp. GSMTC-2017]